MRCACIKYAKSFSIFVCQDFIHKFSLKAHHFHCTAYFKEKQNHTEATESKENPTTKEHTSGTVEREQMEQKHRPNRIGARIKRCRYRIMKVFMVLELLICYDSVFNVQ